MSDAGAPARRLAAEVLDRVARDGAYANMALRAALDGTELPPADRRFVTHLVDGTLRMRRACDFLVDRFLTSPPPAAARTMLRLGAYQLAFAGVPPHAAVSATVAASPARYRGLVNAVLRKVASHAVTWPDPATRLSYPDWIVERLSVDLGEADAMAALETMDEPPQVMTRDDGYVQDLASQWVVDEVGAPAGDVVVDVCAAPGGKATGLAARGARVLAMDVRRSRASLIAANVGRLGLSASVAVAVGDGRHPPLRSRCADHVLVDAPCSGLGVLRRRADARWRIEPDDVERLAALQRELLVAAVDLVRPGGSVTYSVCTLTAAETVGVASVLDADPRCEPLAPPAAPWRPWGRGALLLPQDAGTDGMALFRWAVRS